MVEKKQHWKHVVRTVLVGLFWLLLWQIAAIKLDKAIFLPKPIQVFRAFIRIGGRKSTLEIMMASFIRIMKGFLLALPCGFLFALFSHFCPTVKNLLQPLMRLMKAVPVASFTILALLWTDGEHLAQLVAAVIVLPVVYINLLEGFEKVSPQMLEMAKVFRVPWHRKIRFIYLPSVYPALLAACKIGLGFCFKAGIAAEVIGRPANSIGSQLYEAKLYLLTDELFAWTAVIVLLSMIFEGSCIYILNRIGRCIKRIHRIRIQKPEGDNQQNASEAETKAGSDNKEALCLTVEQVGKSYGTQRVLNEISFVVKGGERLCFRGASGIGKTTLLRLVLGLERQETGRIHLTGIKKMAAVFQEDRLMEDTDVYSNLYFTSTGTGYYDSACQEEHSDEHWREKRKGFDFAQADRHLAMIGLAGLGGRMTGELSGGMKRRVAIVRAVMSCPQLLVLDEPFTGLDEDSRRLAADYIDMYCKEAVVLLVTHDKEEEELMQASVYEMKPT